MSAADDALGRPAVLLMTAAIVLPLTSVAAFGMISPCRRRWIPWAQPSTPPSG
jgi:hypothetical protein